MSERPDRAQERAKPERLGATRLEQQYRRLSRLFPPEWRAENEDELVGTLLDAADPGRHRVSLAEAVDLVRGAAILRARALRASAARIALVALAVGAVLGLALAIRVSAQDVSADFVLTSLVVALVPGTGVVYTVSSSITGGWPRGLFAAVGCTLGVVPHLMAALLGLSGVMQAGAVAFETVRWVGVAYLVLMGISMIRDRSDLRPDDDGHDGHDGLSTPGEAMGLVVRRAVLLNLLNPKLTVFFFAFLPQFLDSPPGLLDARLVGLGGVFMLMTLVVFVVYAGASAAVRERVLGTPALARWIRRSLGAVLVGFAARLAVTDR